MGLAAVLCSLSREDLLAAFVWLAKYQDQLNTLRSDCMALEPEPAKSKLIMDWPVMQGTRMQIWLARIGDLPCDNESLKRVVPALGRYADALAISKVND